MSIFFPTSSIRSLVSIIIFLGESFLPVILAGQTLVHLPHSVHEYEFNNCNLFKSITSEAPNFSISSESVPSLENAMSGSIINLTSFVTLFKLLISPKLLSLAKYVFGKAKRICKCFEKYK